MTNRLLLGALAASMAMTVTTALAGTTPSMEEMWSIIQKQQQEIQKQQKELRELRSRLGKTEKTATIAEKKAEEATVVAAEAAAPAKEAAKDSKDAKDEGSQSAQATAEKWFEKLKFGGRIEVEADSSRSFAKVTQSDLYLSKAKLTVDADIDPWVKARLAFEHDETPNSAPPTSNNAFVDEAVITIGNEEATPFFAAAGRMYLPFGSWQTAMISNTLPQNFGENRQTAVQLGGKQDGFRGSIYTFNGDAKVTRKHDTMDQWGADVGYSYEKNDIKFNSGIDFINSIQDSKNLPGMFPALNGLGLPMMSNWANHVSAVDVFASLQVGKFVGIGEYLATTRSFTANEVLWKTGGAQPKAWQAELDYNTKILGKDTVFGISYQGTAESLALASPKNRYMAGTSMTIYKNTTLQLEYAHDIDYATTDGGTGGHADSGKVKLAVNF